MTARNGHVAVVVATRNRSRSLTTTIEALRALPERPRVVVVDNASTDGTPEHMAGRFPDVDIIPLRENLGAAARTIGARRVRTEYVAFSDDDSWWEPGALARAADHFRRHPRLALVAARILVGPRGALDPVSVEMARSPLPRRSQLPGPPILGFVACGSVVRRSAFLHVGGFNPTLGLGGEELLLALDLAARGYDLAYAEDVVARHYPAPGLRDGRTQALVRNDLWIAWMRRRPAGAVRATLRTLASAITSPAGRRGIADAVVGLPWALRERQPVPARVEDQLRLLGR
jgi:GT2 family glycosyltransferase